MIAVFLNLEPAEVKSFSKHLKQRYKYTQFISENEEWPPDQPKHFTALGMIQRKSERTEEEVFEIIRISLSGDVDRVMSPTYQKKAKLSEEIQESQEQPQATKNIVHLLSPSEDGQETRSVLIEGAPGIGKTVLSKEISTFWANGLLLLEMVLVFLIFLRNPLVQKIKSLKDLVKFYYQFDDSSNNIADRCAEYLLQSDGKHVAFLLDGYDEFPETLQQSEGFISDLLQRKILPACVLVVTSRHYASAHLHRNFDRRVDILGFTEDDRLHFIRSSLKGRPSDVNIVVNYLERNPTINKLCFIPFNMTVLLWLYKVTAKLPTDFSELYNYFVCNTIRHHLAKQVKFDQNIPDLHSLPQPYKSVVRQLAALSYEAVNRFQLIFTLEEIRNAYPQIDNVPGALNCFGLLQVVKYFGPSGSIVSVNFLHFSIQEFLAAYHVSCLPHQEEFDLLNKDFMSPFHINIFNMYVGITKGQRPAFLEYITGYKVTTPDEAEYPFKGITIRPELVNSKNSALHFLLRLHGVDNQELCTEFIKASIFSKGVIDFDNFKLLIPSEVECLGLLFISQKKWHKLGLYRSFQDIRDTGVKILHKVLSTNAPVIHKINLTGNNLTPSVSCLIADIVKSCQTKHIQVQYNLLQGILPLLKGTHLKGLCIDVTDEESVVTDVIEFLQGNRFIELLCLHTPHYRECEELSNESAVKIARALKHNDSLQILRFPVEYRRGIFLPGNEHKNDDLWSKLTTDSDFNNFEVRKEGTCIRYSVL